MALKNNAKLKYSDQELMAKLAIDADTLKRFKEIREATMKEAAGRLNSRNKKIRVLGISGSARDELGMAQEKSNSEELLNKCLEYCQVLGAEIELLPLRRYDIKPCQACYSTANTHCHFYCSCYPKDTPQSDDMSNVIYDKILAADIIIFATPVNNFKISSLLATFIDRCISLDGSLPPANPKTPKDKALNITHTKFVEMTANNDIPGSGFLRRFSGKIAGIIVTGHEEGAALAISSLFMTLNHFGMLFPPFSNMYAMSSVCLSTYQDKPLVVSRCYEEETKLLAENLITMAALGRQSKKINWKTEASAN
jgi:multimeric flavodoxin WrbA